MGKENSRKRQKRHNVRLTENEHRKIKAHSNLSGKSIDSLLRETYFRRTVGLHIVSQDELKGIGNVLSKIGNEVDQILKGTADENCLDNVLSGLADLKKRINCGL